MTWSLAGTDTGTSFEYRFEIRAPVGFGWLGRMLLSQFTSHLATELPALARRYS